MESVKHAWAILLVSHVEIERMLLSKENCIFAPTVISKLINREIDTMIMTLIYSKN